MLEHDTRDKLEAWGPHLSARNTKAWVEIILKDTVHEVIKANDDGTLEDSTDSLESLIIEEQEQRISELIDNQDFTRLNYLMQLFIPLEQNKAQQLLKEKDYESLKFAMCRFQYRRVKKMIERHLSSEEKRELSNSEDEVKRIVGVAQYKRLKKLFDGVLNSVDLISDVFNYETLIDDEKAILPVSLEVFLDQEQWYDNRANLRLFRNISDLGYDLRELGKRCAKESIALKRVMSLVSVAGARGLFETARKINRRWNKTKEVEMVYQSALPKDLMAKIKEDLKIPKNHSIVIAILNYFKGMDPENETINLINEFNYGYYSAFLEIAGFKDSDVIAWQSKLKGDESYSCVGHWRPESLIRSLWNYAGEMIIEGGITRFLWPDNYKRHKRDALERNKALEESLRLREDIEHWQIKFNQISEREKDAVRLLLESVYPRSVARAIIQGYYPLKIDNATVALTDTVQFTKKFYDKSGDQIQSFINWLFDSAHLCIRRYGGSLFQSTGDGVLLEFGITHNSTYHTLQAVLCMLELQKIQEENNRDSEVPAELRIGISLGDIRSFLLTSPGKIALQYQGTDLNLTERLQKNSDPGKMAVSDRVYERIKTFFQFEEKGEVQGKGHEQPFKVYMIERLKKVTECENRLLENARQDEKIKQMEDKVEIIYQELQLRLRYPIRSPDPKANKQEESQEVKLVQVLKSGREYLTDLDQRCVDFLALNAYDGDPLSSKTIALISYSISERLKESDSELMVKLSYLFDVGKKHIYKTISEDYGFQEKTYDPMERYSPEERAKMLMDIKNNTLLFLEKSDNPELIPYVEDFYESRETVEAQILKAAQIYVGIKVPKAHKQQSNLTDEEKQAKIISAFNRENIPEKIINSMYDLGLLEHNHAGKEN